MCMTGTEDPSASCPASINYSCEKELCSPTGGFPSFPTKIDSPDLSYEHCQEGGAGETLYFVVQGGAGCESGTEGFPSITAPGLCTQEQQAVQVSCAARIASQTTCTGADGVGKECVW